MEGGRAGSLFPLTRLLSSSLGGLSPIDFFFLICSRFTSSAFADGSDEVFFCFLILFFVDIGAFGSTPGGVSDDWIFRDLSWALDALLDFFFFFFFCSLSVVVGGASDGFCFILFDLTPRLRRRLAALVEDVDGSGVKHKMVNSIRIFS